MPTCDVIVVELSKQDFIQSTPSISVPLPSIPCQVCDQSVALASTWLLENDWRELVESEAGGEYQVSEVGGNAGARTEGNGPAAVQESQTRVGPDLEQNAAEPTSFWLRRPVGRYELAEQLDEEEEDQAAENDEEEDDDEDEDEMLDDSGDGAVDGVSGVPPLLKRVKISKGGERSAGDDDFWVAFDGQVVMKSMIGMCCVSVVCCTCPMRGVGTDVAVDG
ncbi:unnamed protein product [Phytophthora fragariaefolia]|uniref:Unnamed protein product n=1 Tax=Phytophthora fragariaefolia TaxID=1490495 RepID=A0A9W6XYI4_9STRA|nr:unnamed protein product [Phytophthora fragariaefolia]